MKKHIGFIGLGLMGLPMAKNILKAGFPLMVYNRSLEKTKELVSLGATLGQTPGDLGRVCDVVITMVTGPEDVRAVLFGKDGVAASPKDGLIVIDMSTIGPTAARQIGSELSDRSIRFADAPVTGSIVRAVSGELTVFIGADRDVFEEIRTVLQSMGTTLHHMGPVGSGQSIKLVNNYFVGVEAIALSEGMLLADQMNIDRAKAAEVLQSASTGMSPIMKLVIGNHATGQYPVIFSLSNMRKDITLGWQEMKGRKMPMMELTKSVYDKGVSEGLDEMDFSAIIQVMKKEEE